MSSCIMEAKNLCIDLGGTRILENINLKIKKGETLAVLGQSGCGKSTLLRAIAGLGHISTGEIILSGKLASSKSVMTHPENRSIGLLFQDDALFPHLSVEKNIMFGLRRLERKKRLEVVTQWLEQVGLKDYRYTFPNKLSGGQRQRVAIARALAPQPKLLLLDEPFSKLDHDLREVMKGLLKKIIKETEISTLLVTHTADEAFDLSDQIAVMENKTISQIGDQTTVYKQPVSEAAAGLLGIYSKIDLKQFTKLAGEEAKYQAIVRPEDICLNEESNYKGYISEIFYRGHATFYQISTEDNKVVMILAPAGDNKRSVGEKVGLTWNSN